MLPKNAYQHSLIKDLLKDDQVKDLPRSSSFTAEPKKKQIAGSSQSSEKKSGRPPKEKHLLADTPIINVNINST